MLDCERYHHVTVQILIRTKHLCCSMITTMLNYKQHHILHASSSSIHNIHIILDHAEPPSCLARSNRYSPEQKDTRLEMIDFLCPSSAPGIKVITYPNRLWFTQVQVEMLAWLLKELRTIYPPHTATVFKLTQEISRHVITTRQRDRVLGETTFTYCDDVLESCIGTVCDDR